MQKIQTAKQTDLLASPHRQANLVLYLQKLEF